MQVSAFEPFDLNVRFLPEQVSFPNIDQGLQSGFVPQMESAQWGSTLLQAVFSELGATRFRTIAPVDQRAFEAGLASGVYFSVIRSNRGVLSQGKVVVVR
jgi:hypothetical protein